MAHVKPLTSEEGYYEAAEEYAGQITKIIFTFIPPNALRAEEKVSAFIKEASKDAKSEYLRHEYDSPSGHLEPKADLLAGSERVAAAGGGETIMKAGRRTIFNSARHKLTTFVSKQQMPESGNILQTAAFIKSLFKRAS